LHIIYNAYSNLEFGINIGVVITLAM